MEGDAMRRLAIALGLVLAASAPRALAWESRAEPETIEEAVFEELAHWPWEDEEEGQEDGYVPDDLEAAAADLLRRLRETIFRVRAVAYRFDRLPADLEPMLHGASGVLGPEEAAAIAAHVRGRTLVPLRTATAAGPPGDDLLGRDLDRRGAPLHREIESAQEAVVSFPRVVGLRAGLRLRAEIALTAAPGATLRYGVSLADAPVLETRPSIGGTLDYVSVPALLAEGTVRLLPGEAAAIVRVEADGSGRLVLLSVAGDRPDVDVVTDLGHGYVAAFAAHLGPADVLPLAGLRGIASLGERLGQPEPIGAVWDPFAQVAGVDAENWYPAPYGVRLGTVEPSARKHLETLLVRGAGLAGTRGRIHASREGWGRFSLPASPGHTFRFFAGTVGTELAGTDVESGCHVCVLAVPRSGWSTCGLSAAGRACVDGSVDLDLVGREILDVEPRTFALRRIEPGYRTYARDAFEIPLVTERVLSCRAALPAGASRLPGGVRLGFRFEPPPLPAGCAAAHRGLQAIEGALPVGGGGYVVSDEAGRAAAAAFEPVRLRVSGEPLAVRPGVASWVELWTHHPFVRLWDSEGWCGMRARFPVPDRADAYEPGTSEGIAIDLLLRSADGALLLDASGEVYGAPDDLSPFDPGDGVVRLVRSPRLLFDVRALPLGGGGRLVHGAGLALVVEREGKGAGLGEHQRLEFQSDETGPAGLVTGRHAGGWLDAGAERVVPSAFEAYSSSHRAGQVCTVPVGRKEGVVLRVDAKREHARVDVRVRGRPTLEPLPLKVDVEPDRPETDLTLLGLRRRFAERVLLLDAEDALEFENPDPSWPFRVTARVVASGDAK